MTPSDAWRGAENVSPSSPEMSTGRARDQDISGYRPFLDGLRAIAVLGVLTYHLNRSWLPGGYLGVDLFFVLSGYLITSLLVAEHARTGRIDLPAFWSRRIRRLLPALLVVLLVVAVIVNLRGDLLAEGAARGDLLATLLYVANWHFITSGQSYFSQYVSVSPLRHMWSLAVEEQFYLLWPLVTVAVLARFPRRVLLGLAIGVAWGSAILMALLFDQLDPSRAYYGTDTRIFEILVGAGTALILAGRGRARLRWIAARLAWPAFVGVILGFALLADDDAVYYHGAALALAVTIAVLIAGLECGGGPQRLLSLRPLVLVGLVSYGLYLWHFPVITFINQSMGPTSFPPLAILAVAIALAATAISYQVVEKPIRRRGLLLGFRLTPRRLLGVVPAASGIVAIVVMVSTASGISSPDWAGAHGDVAGRSAAPASLSLTTPAPTTLVAQATAGLVIHEVGVVGDSVVVSALPGLRSAAAARGWTLVAAAADGCPIAPQPLYDDAGNPSPLNDACRQVAALHAELIAHRPDVLIWEDLQSVLSRRAPDGTFLPAGSPAWTTNLIDSWTAELRRFLAIGTQVILVMPPQRSQEAVGCRNVPGESRCLDVQRQDGIIRAATTAFWSSLDGEARVHRISVDSLLCPTGVPCPSEISGITVRISGYDQTHFTAAGAQWFAPRFLDLVVASLEAGP